MNISDRRQKSKKHQHLNRLQQQPQTLIIEVAIEKNIWYPFLINYLPYDIRHMANIVSEKFV